MKLSIYLRGLGIGIVVTALLMGLSGGRRQTMTDAEIIARAELLGMVKKDNVLLATDSNKATDSKTEDSEKDAVNSDNKTSDPDKEAFNQGTEKPNLDSKTEDVTSSPKADNTSIDLTGQKNQTSDVESENTGSFQLEIANGSSSSSVSLLLKKGGLIDNAEDFDKYLCQNGYDSKICAGIHKIPEGADFESIAEIITTRQ